MSQCPPGQIQRVGYTYTRQQNNTEVTVPSTCVPDQGKPGKGPKLIQMPESDIGLLSKYGNQIKIINNIPEKIVELNLSENQITEINNLPNQLIILDLYGNQINTINNLNDQIKELDLACNLIQTIENLPPNLEILKIYENQINNISLNIVNLKFIKDINYCNNPIIKTKFCSKIQLWVNKINRVNQF